MKTLIALLIIIGISWTTKAQDADKYAVFITAVNHDKEIFLYTNIFSSDSEWTNDEDEIIEFLKPLIKKLERASYPKIDLDEGLQGYSFRVMQGNSRDILIEFQDTQTSDYPYRGYKEYRLHYSK